ncbi:hypothetical protein MBLNU457_g0004t1 [Dothideomycetes sp. NU457]
MTDSNLDSCTELVIVCCHAIFNINTQDPWNEENWHLKPFQKPDKDTSKVSEHFTFISHIQAAAESLRRPNTFVVFSGGATDRTISYSEAESYEKVFLSLYSDNAIVMRGHRWTTEKNATDSYQNLLFSIVQFRKISGRYPDTITIITHAFKSDRFLQLHALAIGWPRDRIRVLGINPPFSLSELDQVQEAERENAFALFEKDMYGNDRPLKGKRIARGWTNSKLESISDGLEPKVRELLWCRSSAQSLHSGELPWES